MTPPESFIPKTPNMATLNQNVTLRVGSTHHRLTCERDTLKRLSSVLKQLLESSDTAQDTLDLPHGDAEALTILLGQAIDPNTTTILPDHSLNDIVRRVSLQIKHYGFTASANANFSRWYARVRTRPFDFDTSRHLLEAAFMLQHAPIFREVAGEMMYKHEGSFGVLLSSDHARLPPLLALRMEEIRAAKMQDAVPGICRSSEGVMDAVATKEMMGLKSPYQVARFLLRWMVGQLESRVLRYGEEGEIEELRRLPEVADDVPPWGELLEGFLESPDARVKDEEGGAEHVGAKSG